MSIPIENLKERGIIILIWLDYIPIVALQSLVLDICIGYLTKLRFIVVKMKEKIMLSGDLKGH